MKVFTGIPEDYKEICFFDMNVTELTGLIQTEHPRAYKVALKFCIDLPIKRGARVFSQEIIKIKYPYDMWGYIFSYYQDEIIAKYIILKDVTNGEHQFPGCEERPDKTGSRNIFCEIFRGDYLFSLYTTIINDELIQFLYEPTWVAYPYHTCFMFNDCYGCLLVRHFPCMWLGSACVNVTRRQGSFRDCVSIPTIIPRKYDVTLILRGVRLTNTFMKIELIPMSGNGSYEPTSISNHEATFDIDNEARIASNFTLKIHQTDDKGFNKIELAIDFLHFKMKQSHHRAHILF